MYSAFMTTGLDMSTTAMQMTGAELNMTFLTSVSQIINYSFNSIFGGGIFTNSPAVLKEDCKRQFLNVFFYN